MTQLDLAQAAKLVGVPTHQLRLWAWDRVGPHNIGTRIAPRYERGDLLRWLHGKVRASA